MRESSSFEGADPGTAAAASAAAAGGLDPAAFLSSLSAILGTGFDGPGGGGGDNEGESSDESSDFYDDGNGDSSDAISDEEGGAGLPSGAHPSTATTPSDVTRDHLVSLCPGVLAISLSVSPFPDGAIAACRLSDSSVCCRSMQVNGVSESSLNIHILNAVGRAGWPDAQTDTDSDDEAPGRRAGFMDQYGDVLNDQLAGTAMGKSFERVADLQSTAEQGSGSRPVGDVAGASGEASGAPDDDREDDEQGGSGGALRPVDIDLNLVSSLLASFESQQGMPGPASNMAGMLGLHLPPLPQKQPGPRGEGGSQA